MKSIGAEDSVKFNISPVKALSAHDRQKWQLLVAGISSILEKGEDIGLSPERDNLLALMFRVRPDILTDLQASTLLSTQEPQFISASDSHGPVECTQISPFAFSRSDNTCGNFQNVHITGTNEHDCDDLGSECSYGSHGSVSASVTHSEYEESDLNFITIHHRPKPNLNLQVAEDLHTEKHESSYYTSDESDLSPYVENVQPFTPLYLSPTNSAYDLLVE